ncbi:hypothetical protein [Pelomonas sp. Root1217]|uniref:hypothetical protein n=1 Tax=Pelomonas sp. Root1217 TaxID=1736430 RepID=UPI0012FB9630|nr:hypothetical protein [Pelomonas sp. Root1217]
MGNAFLAESLSSRLPIKTYVTNELPTLALHVAKFHSPADFSEQVGWSAWTPDGIAAIDTDRDGECAFFGGVKVQTSTFLRGAPLVPTSFELTNFIECWLSWSALSTSWSTKSHGAPAD